MLFTVAINSGLHPSLEALNHHVASGIVELITPYQLSALHGQNGLLERVESRDWTGV